MERDPNYNWVEPIKRLEYRDIAQSVKRGVQCGQCGMKFDYNVTYGYHCPQTNCPCGQGGMS